MVTETIVAPLLVEDCTPPVALSIAELLNEFDDWEGNGVMRAELNGNEFEVE